MKHLTSFKIFENVEHDKLVPIATNEINWGWEDDSVNIKATILFDPTGSNDLFLHIRKVHTKHGIGAGQFPSDVLSYEPIGKINKPDLRKVQTLLREHRFGSSSRAGGGGFKRQWSDMKGDTLALSKIISQSRYLKLTDLKHKLSKKHKTISEPVKSEPVEDIKISKYGRGYVIYGIGTKAIKDKLKQIGARFNFSLKNPETGEKMAGWVFPPTKLDAIQELIGVQVNESYAPEELHWLKDEIKANFDDYELKSFFPKIYEEFFDIIVEDSELDYLKSEDPDALEFDFADATQVYIIDNDDESLEIEFLKAYLNEKEYSNKNVSAYRDLMPNARIIYDNLEQRLEIVFWTALEIQLTSSL